MPIKTIQDFTKGLLSLEQCNKLTTPRLLAYFKSKRYLMRIRRCHCCGELLTKEDQKVNNLACEYLQHIKELLDSREHINKNP